MSSHYSSSSPPRVALITGGARRIGSYLTRGLHAAGYNIALHFRDSMREAESLARELNLTRADSVKILQFDLEHTTQLQQLAFSAQQLWGRIDVLINNASMFYPTPLDQISIQAWDELLGVNLKAPLFLTVACAPFLAVSNGCVVNIIDIHADRPLKNYSLYCIAKAGLAMLTKSMARELAPAVRVNGIAPGAILWPEVAAYENVHQEIIQRTALKREGHPSDIVETAIFLIDHAAYVTGQIIAVDGGRTLSN